MLTAIMPREPLDLTRIDVADERELHWWSTHLSVTPQALRAAVDEHGPSTEEIRSKLHEAARQAFNKGGED